MNFPAQSLVQRMDTLRLAMEEAKARQSRARAAALGKRKRDAGSDGEEEEEDEGGASKYIRRGELKQREAEARAAASKAKRQAKREARLGSESSPPATSGRGAPKGEEVKEEAGGDEKDDKYAGITTDEVKAKLRIMGEPITLFGETHQTRLDRLRRMTVLAHERETGASAGRLNVLKSINDEIESEILAATMNARDQRGAEDDDEDEEAAERRRVIEAAAQAKKERRELKYAPGKTRSDFACDESYVAHFLKRMLHEWEGVLNQRPESVKVSPQGRADSATQKQTRQYIKPLLKLLKQKQLQGDILMNLCKIVSNCCIREYVKANEAYLLLAIGNAAWPMGVTMVGIHARTGRENIAEGGVAHVLNDETQRKYIQSVKRLMSFAQAAYPTDPSKQIG